MKRILFALVLVAITVGGCGEREPLYDEDQVRDMVNDELRRKGYQ